MTGTAPGSTMRAAVVDAFGDVDTVRLAHLPTPEVGPRDVLIQVACAGINPSDWKEIQGGLADPDGRSLVVPGRQYRFPLVTGRDAAGVVVARGSDVLDLAIGQPVITASDGPAVPGTFAEYVRVRADRVAPVPAGLDLRLAAALPVAGTTAWQALHPGGRDVIRSGSAVLVHGAAGGVGTFAVQLARQDGAAVAGTARRRNADYVRSLGADLVVDYQTDDLRAAIRAWRLDGVDVVVDVVGARQGAELVDVIRPGGLLVSVATVTDDDDTGERDRAAAAAGVEHVVLVVTSRGARTQLGELAARLDAGTLRLPALRCFGFADVAEALRLSRDDRPPGKLILQVGRRPRH